MSSYSVSNIAPNAIKSAYLQAKSTFQGANLFDLDIIFNIALYAPTLFPNISLQNPYDPNNPYYYFSRWIKGYFDAINNPPSLRTASPKSTCNDPAINMIVMSTKKMTPEQVAYAESNHNLFMSAENIQGNLLEEYIACCVRRYGFVWCAGNVLRAVDFCNTNGSLLLQVKNKSNTENSSSSNIREGTSIQKWYRLGTQSKMGVKSPIFRWEQLNVLISNYRTEGSMLKPCDMNERSYELFLNQAASKNPMLITNL